MSRNISPEIEEIRAQMRGLEHPDLGETRPPLVVADHFEVEVANGRVEAWSHDQKLVHHASLKGLLGDIVKDLRLQWVNSSKMLGVEMENSYVIRIVVSKS